MANWTRVRDKRTGHQYSVRNVNEEYHEVLPDERAAARNGKPLPPKPKRNLKPASGEAGELESLTVSQLRDEAREAGVEGFSSMNKQELIESLEGDN